MIHLLTAIGLTDRGTSTVYIYTQTIHRTTRLTTLATQVITFGNTTLTKQLTTLNVGRLTGIRTQSSQTKINVELTAYIYRLIGKSAGRVPSLRVVPWHLPYT